MTSTNLNLYSTNMLRIVYSGISLMDDVNQNLSDKFNIYSTTNPLQFRSYLKEQTLNSLPEIILIEADESGDCFKDIETIRQNPLLCGLIIILISSKPNKLWKEKALKLRIHDFYVHPFSYDELTERLNFLVKFKLIKPDINNLESAVTTNYEVHFNKRLFDLAFSITCLLFLLPLFLIVAACIAVESKGKIIYSSKRVGTGYKIFDFYKFRSMRSDADADLHKLSKNLNQYDNNDDKAGKSVFVKLKNDPRVTRVGAFLRKTSIDELPQLINILKGDMSVVGNRPLPLYEAEKLTSNEWATRFLGPAGLTGLWQISKRGQSDMSELERKQLDNYYALNYSFRVDLKIIIKTFPALIQKEKV